MQKQALDTVQNAVETAYETTKQVADINAAAWESLIEKQLEVMNQVVDFGVKQYKLLGEVKDVKTTLAAQTGLVETAAEQAMTNVRDVVRIANDARTAYDKLVNKGVQDAVAAVKPKVTKKAA
jgi:phasin family protein